MLRNMKFKNFLVDNIFPVFSFVNKFIPKNKKYVLIYCANDGLRDNAGAIYSYLTEKNYPKKYKIICCVQNSKKYKENAGKNVMFLPKQLGIIVYMISRHVFYSEGKIPIIPTENQIVIFLTHGIPLKKSVDFKSDYFFTYMSITSEFFRDKIAVSYNCPKSKICICGEPKTDKMFSYQENEEDTKLIIWTPTFRQSDYLGYNDSEMDSFLPFINNNEWSSFNDELREKNVKIIAKLHPAQNVSGFTEALYSNLEIYSDKAFRHKGLELYELLGQSNALIADYSSVYLEYLLLNRPIGFALADYEDYKKTRGFVLGDQIEYMPGKKIYSRSDLLDYIDDIINNKDMFKANREKMADLFHCYKDSANTKRILDIAGITM